MTDATHTERFNDPQGRTATSSQAVVASASPALFRFSHGCDDPITDDQGFSGGQVKDGPAVLRPPLFSIYLLLEPGLGLQPRWRYQWFAGRVQAANEASRPERQYGRWPFSGRGQVCACPRHSLANEPDTIIPGPFVSAPQGSPRAGRGFAGKQGLDVRRDRPCET